MKYPLLATLVVASLAVASGPPADAGWCPGGSSGRTGVGVSGGGSMPTSGSAGVGRRGGGTAQRFTEIYWHEVSVEQPKVITGKSADPAPTEGTTGGKTEVDEEQERRDHLLRSLNVRGGETRPLLLYFHWDHEDKDLGKAQIKQCKVMDDEKVARWAGLFHCAEVDVEGSDRKLLEGLGVGDKPSFAVVTPDLKLVSTATALNTSRKVLKFLKDSLEEEALADYWKTVEDELDRQQDKIKRARKLIKKKELLDAHGLLEDVRFSELRIGKFWDDVVSEYQDVDKAIKEDR